jgi:WD40 repeat protein
MRRSTSLPALLATLFAVPGAFIACGTGQTSSRVSALPAATVFIQGPMPCEIAAKERKRVPDLVAQGRLDHTIRVIERAASLCPATAPETWVVQLEVLVELGHHEEARKLAELIEASPMSSNTARKAARNALQTLATVQGKPGDKAMAQRAYDIALQALEQKQYAEAKKGFLEAWSLDRPYGEALLGAGLGAKGLGDRAEAQRLFDRARVEIERVGANMAVVEGLPVGSGPRAVSRDQRLVAITYNNVVVVYDQRASLHARATLYASPQSIKSVAFSPDSQILVSADDDVHLWSVATGAKIRTLKGGSGGLDDVVSLAFSPDGQILAAGGGGVSLWNVATGAEIHKFGVGRVSFVAFSPDGQTLAADGDEQDIHLWSMPTGAEIRMLDRKRDYSNLKSLAFSTDGQTLTVETSVGGVEVWDVKTGKPKAQRALIPDDKQDQSVLAIRANLPPHQDSKSGDIVFAPDGQTLAWTADGGRVRFWSLAKGNELRMNAGSRVWYSPDGKTMAIRDGKTIHLSAVESGATLGKVEGSESCKALSFGSDGKILTLVYQDRVDRWDPVTGSITRTPVELPRRAWEREMDISPDGKILAVFDGPYDLVLLDVETGAKLLRFVPERRVGEFRTLEFSPDGQQLAIGALDGSVTLLNPATGKQTGAVSMYLGLKSLLFSSDGQTLASAIDFFGVGVGFWSIATGKLVRQFPAAYISSVALSSRAVAWSNQNGVHVQIGNGPEVTIRTLKGQNVGYVMTEGAMELLGDDAEAATAALVCRVGARLYPIDLCRERYETHDILAKVFAGEMPGRDP